MLRNLLILMSSLLLVACASTSTEVRAPVCDLSCKQPDARLGEMLDDYLRHRHQLDRAGFFSALEGVYQRGGWQSRHQMHQQVSQEPDPQRARQLNFYAVTGLLDEMVALYRLNGETLAQAPIETLQIPVSPSPFVADTLDSPPQARLQIVQQWTQIVSILTDDMVDSIPAQEDASKSPSVTESP
ncbi:hypothetical protein KUV89_14050 [Marinobacter hydrocarbonoclasticus]|nr:hypothetical protein [Marinobacter nauticus]